MTNDWAAGGVTGRPTASRPDGGLRPGGLPRVGPTTAGWSAVAALASAIAVVTPFLFSRKMLVMHQFLLGKPRLKAEVVFFGREHMGRIHPPSFSPSHPYMPHIVIQERSVLQAAIIGHILTEPYKGVAFIDQPTDPAPGTPGISGLVLMYYPEVDYADVQPGATFTIREGGKVVGHGVVLTRDDPSAG